MLVVKHDVNALVGSVSRSVRSLVCSKTLVATVTALLISASLVCGANLASADSVQYQSYQRASQTEACVAQVGETPWQAAWGADSSWKPSWERWANAGSGGWTCTRTIVWAKTPVSVASSAPVHPSAGCIALNLNSFSINFQSGWYIPASALVYLNPTCSSGVPALGKNVVYAPAGYDATTLCLEAFGVLPNAYVDRLFGSDVFGCDIQIT